MHIFIFYGNKWKICTIKTFPYLFLRMISFLLNFDLWKYILTVQKMLELKNKKYHWNTNQIFSKLFHLVFASFVIAIELIQFFGKFWIIFLEFFWAVGCYGYKCFFRGILAIFGYCGGNIYPHLCGSCYYISSLHFWRTDS